MNEIDLIYWKQRDGNRRVYETYCRHCSKEHNCGILLVYRATGKKPQEWTWGNIRGSSVNCASYEHHGSLF